MNEKSLTKEEFIKKYPAPEIKDFFSHIERYTSEESSQRLDFYRFYGISRDLIKSDNGYNYQIPESAAPLLAAMIIPFSRACGYDGRSRSKKAPIRFSYEQYHNYIQTAQEEVEKLEPRLKAVVQNYKSFDNTQIADAFIPLLAERISSFLVLLFAYGKDENSDYLPTAIRYIDVLIESLFRRRLEQSTPLDSQKEYSFESALGESFRFFAEKNYYPSYENHVFSPELMKTMFAAKNSSNNQLDEQLDARCNESLKSHTNKNLTVKSNIEAEKKYLESFWTSESFAERLLLENTISYREELAEALKVAVDYYEGEKSPDELQTKIMNQATAAFHEKKWILFDQYYQATILIEKYKDELEYWYEKNTPLNSELQEFLSECACDALQSTLNGALIQATPESSSVREQICKFYEEISSSNILSFATSQIEHIITSLLPAKLK